MWGLLKEAFAKWNADNVSRLSASIAYYTIFSAAPLLVIAIALAGSIFGETAAKGELVLHLRNLIGNEAAAAIQGMVDSAGQFQSGLVATAVGAFALIFGATGVFTEVQSALNTIWGIPEKGSWKSILKSRFLSFIMILAVGFLLLALLVATTALSLVSRFFDFLPGFTVLVDMFNFLLTFAIITFLFAIIYKILPDVKMSWSDVWAGSAFTSLLFSIGKLLIGFYLGSGRMKSVYGAAGSIIILLFWFYFSAQVFLFGAEFTRVYSIYRSKEKRGEEGKDVREREE